MPTIGFGNSSNISESKICTSLVVKKLYLRTDYIKSKIEEKMDLKNQFRSKNLKDPIDIREAAAKNYYGEKINHPIIIKNTAHVYFDDKNLDNVRFVKVNSKPAVGEHLTANYYVGNAIPDSVDVSSLLKLDPNEKLELCDQDSIFLDSTLRSTKTIIEKHTKSYNDTLHENNRTRLDLSSVFCNQGKEYDFIKTPNLDSNTVNRNPSSNNEVSIKRYVEALTGEGTLVGFYQRLQNHLKVSLGNDTYNFTKQDKTKSTGTETFKYPNSGRYLLQRYYIKCNDKNGNVKKQRFIRSTKTNSPSGYSGAASFPPLGDSFKYGKTRQKFSGSENTLVSFERTDIIQIIIISFHHNRF